MHRDGEFDLQMLKILLVVTFLCRITKSLVIFSLSTLSGTGEQTVSEIQRYACAVTGARDTYEGLGLDG